MGAVDVERQALNVFRMKLLGAEVEAVQSGSRTLKDAVNEAMRDWVATVESTHYCLGSVMGPHPYPWMVRELHRVIGDEARQQCRSLLGTDPDVVVACVGGGSNAAGIFSGFVDTDARLVGVEPAGGAAIGHGVPGVVHGMKSYLLQDEYGQVLEAESISAGLDYPGVGPEHAHLASVGRARYESVTDDDVIEAFQLLVAHRGHHPRPRTGARAGVDREGARRAAGPGRVAEPVGPGRQGRRADDGPVAPVTGRLETALRSARESGRKILVPYITGGLAGWIEAIEGAAAAGADAVEVGIPFSDPVMDGPVIQQASLLALQAGATPPAILRRLADLDAGIPVAVMLYYNTVFHAGHERFAHSLVEGNVCAAIVPDLQLDEAGPWCAAADAAGVETVMFAAPTTPDDSPAAHRRAGARLRVRRRSARRDGRAHEVGGVGDHDRAIG